MALNWSFKARLYNASDAMKKRYVAVCDELKSFHGVKISESWDKVRVYIGRKTYATLFFRGKTLCLTLALNPAEFLETKYICEDVSDVARFAATPLLTRMSSDRQVKYLAELLGVLFEGVEKSETVTTSPQIPFHTKDELVAMKLIKVYGGKKTDIEDEQPQPVEKPTACEPVEEMPVVNEEPVVCVQSVEDKTAEQYVEEEQPCEIEQVAETTATVVDESESAETEEIVCEPLHNVAATVSREPLPTEEKAATVFKCTSANLKGEVNLGTIDAFFEEGSEVTLAALKSKGVVGLGARCLKVLAGGELTKPLTIVAHKFSTAALQKIELVGAIATKAEG